MLFFAMFLEISKEQIAQLLRWRDLAPLTGDVKLRIEIAPAVVFFFGDLARFSLAATLPHAASIL